MRIPTPLRAAIVILLLATITVWVGKFLRKPRQSEPLDHLAAFVASRGKFEPLLPEVARYFGIPGESVVLAACAAVSEIGNMRSIGVRVRPGTHYIDMLLMDRQPNVAGAHFYLTTTSGELLQSAFIDTEPHAINDAKKRFDKEVSFWRTWQLEKEYREPH